MALGMIDSLQATEGENLVDYVRWIGGFDFEACPFRDADALVLCLIAYFDLKRLFREAESVPVKDALPLLEAGLSTAQLTGGDGGSSDVVKAACRSKRFGELLIRNHVDILENEPPLQFAAMSFHDGKGMDFLAYRGTDSSLAGWKEDCMTAFTRTDAQRMAADYAHRVLPQAEAWRMGGHSKGGNLVMYAAAHLDDAELEKVIRIYDLDGPGMCEDVYDLALIRRIEPKVTAVIPEFDLIGRFFETKIADTRIIKSVNPEGLGQHALASWEIDHGELSRGEPSEKAEWTMHVINSWLSEQPQDERRLLVDELFDALSVGGTKDLNEITLDRFLDVLLELRRSSKTTRENFIELPKKFLEEQLPPAARPGRALFADGYKDIVLGGAIALIGLILCLLSGDHLLDYAALITMGLVAAYQIYVTVRRFRDRKGRTAGLRDRMYIAIAMIALFIVLIVKQDAAFLLGSLIFAVLFLALAYRQSLYISKARKTSHKAFYVAETAVCGIFGVSFLLIPKETVEEYTLALGIALILDGLTRLITLYLKNK